MVYNSSMGNFKPRRTDIEYIGMAANDLANELETAELAISSSWVLFRRNCLSKKNPIAWRWKMPCIVRANAAQPEGI